MQDANLTIFHYSNVILHFLTIQGKNVSQLVKIEILLLAILKVQHSNYGRKIKPDPVSSALLHAEF